MDGVLVFYTNFLKKMGRNKRWTKSFSFCFFFFFQKEKEEETSSLATGRHRNTSWQDPARASAACRAGSSSRKSPNTEGPLPVMEAAMAPRSRSAPLSSNTWEYRAGSTSSNT